MPTQEYMYYFWTLKSTGTSAKFLVEMQQKHKRAQVRKRSCMDAVVFQLISSWKPQKFLLFVNKSFHLEKESVSGEHVCCRFHTKLSSVVLLQQTSTCTKICTSTQNSNSQLCTKQNGIINGNFQPWMYIFRTLTSRTRTSKQMSVHLREQN